MKMRMHPGRVELEAQNYFLWPLLCFGPVGLCLMLCTMNLKQTQSLPYRKIGLVIKDTNCCGDTSFLIPGLTNVPWRLGNHCLPIFSADQAQLKAFLTDLNKRLDADNAFAQGRAQTMHRVA